MGINFIPIIYKVCCRVYHCSDSNDKQYPECMGELSREELEELLEEAFKLHREEGIDHFDHEKSKQACEQIRTLIQMSGVLQLKNLNQIIKAVNNFSPEVERKFYEMCAKKIQRKVSRERIMEIVNKLDNKMSWRTIVETVAKELGIEVEKK